LRGRGKGQIRQDLIDGLATHAPPRSSGGGIEFNLKETKMNWDRIEGNWKQFKGNAKVQWGKLTDDQLDVVAGKRDSLAGKIQETYGITKEAAEKQLSEWQKGMQEQEHAK